MSAPRGTARLQFNREFTLDDALAVVDYYDALGVSHLYASPIQHARAGSMHGYDTVDYGAIDPELGGLDALRRLVDALRARGMGLVVDIVPNHMAASEENPWWRDVLERGRASAYAEHFDIDWDADDADLRGKVLAPFLSRPYEEALGAIAVRHVDGALVVEADGRRYPLAPETHALMLGEADDLESALARFDGDSPEARERKRRLLDRQHYRLAYWREARTRIDWRRFFDVSELIGLRTDRERVFEDVHAFVFELYAERLIDGVRVDHVDGIANPREYCARLRAGLARARGRSRRRAYVVVEKILACGERLRADWDVEGTTGYEFMDACSAVLHDGGGAAALDALWREIDGRDAFEGYAREARREIAETAFVADIDRLARAWRAAGSTVYAAAMRDAIVRLLEAFDVYRTYVEPGRLDEDDRARLAAAAERARAEATPETREAIGDLLARLTAPVAEAARVQRRFQQLTAPVAAKAVEDTAFYRYGRLISRNEVGADPGVLAMAREAFHAACRERLARTPDALIATATHDHKRGEDVRARLAALSEIPERWSAFVRGWREANAPLRSTVGDAPAPSAADEAMLLQTIVGAWPLDLRRDDEAAFGEFVGRVSAWQLKALREAKRATSWTDPDPDYEAACERYLRAALAPDRAGEIERFVDAIAAAGALNGLAQTVLRLTCPGVPDLYQGTELWDFSLVDPDNRRPVDYARRRAGLAPADAAELMADWRSGRIKQTAIARLLAWRAAYPDLLRRGAYVPLEIAGARERQAIAFQRGEGATAAVVVATRLAARDVRDVPRVEAAHWNGTSVRVGGDAEYWDVLADRGVESTGGELALREVLAVWPVAVLIRV